MCRSCPVRRWGTGHLACHRRVSVGFVCLRLLILSGYLTTAKVLPARCEGNFEVTQSPDWHRIPVHTKLACEPPCDACLRSLCRPVLPRIKALAHDVDMFACRSLPNGLIDVTVRKPWETCQHALPASLSSQTSCLQTASPSR